MTYEELMTEIYSHCPSAQIVASHGAKAALRRQRLQMHVANRDRPPSRPVELRIVDGTGKDVGVIHAQFTPDQTLVYTYELFGVNPGEVVVTPEMTSSRPALKLIKGGQKDE